VGTMAGEVGSTACRGTEAVSKGTALAPLKSFLIAFSVLLPLINPLGSALVFLGLAGEAAPAVYRSLARKIAINNIIFLAIIELLGAAILNFFGISLRLSNSPAASS